jgi:hypothetical protein
VGVPGVFDANAPGAYNSQFQELASKQEGMWAWCVVGWGWGGGGVGVCIECVGRCPLVGVWVVGYVEALEPLSVCVCLMPMHLVHTTASSRSWQAGRKVRAYQDVLRVCITRVLVVHGVCAVLVSV